MEKFTALTSEQTAVMNATALGGVRVLDQLISEIEAAQETGKVIESEEGEQDE